MILKRDDLPIIINVTARTKIKYIFLGMIFAHVRMFQERNENFLKKNPFALNFMAFSK